MKEEGIIPPPEPQQEKPAVTGQGDLAMISRRCSIFKRVGPVSLAVFIGLAGHAQAAGELILVTNTRAGNLSVISRDTHEVIKTIPAGRRPNRLALAPDGRHAYIVNDGSPFIRIFDVVDLKFTGRVRAGRDPYNLAFSPDGKIRLLREYVLGQRIDSRYGHEKARRPHQARREQSGEHQNLTRREIRLRRQRTQRRCQHCRFENAKTH